MLAPNPFPGETIHPGPYRLGKYVEDANTYRVGHPLAQRLLDAAKPLTLRPARLLSTTARAKKIAVLESLLGRSGWLSCARVTVSALETEDQLLFRCDQ